nr:pheromone-processing carboxypeptidase kex1 [Quercus suber]
MLYMDTRTGSGWRSFFASALIGCSLWTIAMSAATEKSAADYYVHSLPGAPSSPQLNMYAGHVEITPEHHGNLFFWLFKNRHIADRRRTVLWLNGGPGCSSLDGAMMEIGPYRVNEDGTLRFNDGGWDEFSNVLFVDNPVGTGFSYVDGDSYLHELGEMADNMILFLEKWFAIFPEHAHDDAIVDRNAKSPGREWNITGLLIGNGWISGPEQYLAYLPFAYQSGIIKPGSEADNKLIRQQFECVEALEKGGAKHVDTGACESILVETLLLSQVENRCVNMYDVRLKDSYPSCGMNWPPDLAQLTPYLRRQDVLQALHINPDKKTGWTECNNQVSSSFRASTSAPSKDLLPGLLKQMPIVLFSGDQDLICNHLGTEDLINKLTWNGATGMELSPGTWAPRLDWTFEGEPAGIYQSARNLTYIKFYNSSHMVPFDYPRRSRDMLDRFIGVDIASIGGKPTDSRIDGEKGLEVSVGGHPNSTTAVEAEKDKLQAATWAAYRRSGEVALVIVLIAASAWGYFVYRERRRRAGYQGVGNDVYEGAAGMSSGLGLNDVRNKYREERDVEAARDFDEAELDELTEGGQRSKEMQGSNFGIGDDETDDDEHEHRANSRA